MEKYKKRDIIIAILTIFAGVIYVFYNIINIDSVHIPFINSMRDLILIVFTGWSIMLFCDMYQYRRNIFNIKSVKRYLSDLLIPVSMILITALLCFAI